MGSFQKLLERRQRAKAFQISFVPHPSSFVPKTPPRRAWKRGPKPAPAELAELNDVAVGPVVSISKVIDSGAYYINEQSCAAAKGKGGGGAGPISPGKVTVSMQLQITCVILQ